MITIDTRPARGEHILAQRNGETLILLSPRSGQYFTLDEVGARVWDLCDGKRRVADLVSIVHAEFDAPLATIQSDILELLDDLTGEQLVAPSADVAPA